MVNTCICGKEIDKRSSRCISCSKIGNDFGKFNKGKIRLDFRGNGNPRWNGGKCLLKTGYIEVISKENNSMNSRGRILEHRKVMEDFLGRKLLRKEVVHHKNGNKQDNRIENLELLNSQTEHKRRHPETEETKAKRINKLKGRVFSKEHKIKLSISARGNTNGKKKE